jgi:hypothetical protein
MKEKIFFLVIVSTIIIILSSCVNLPYIYISDLNQLEPGRRYSESFLSEIVPEMIFTYKDLGKDIITVYAYIKDEQCKGKVFEIFIATYMNERLYYWGNLDDFKKSENSTLQTIGERVAQEFINKIRSSFNEN